MEHRFTLTYKTLASVRWERTGSTSLDIYRSFVAAEHGKHSVLPPPLKPNTRSKSSDEDHGRRTLSDFSDYESSDEEAHKKNVRNAASSSNNYSGRRVYPGASDLDITTGKGLLDDNPFADPFGDSHGVDVSSSVQGGGRQVRL